MPTEIKPSIDFSFNHFVKVSREVYPKNNFKSIVHQLLFYIRAKKNSALIESFYNKIKSLGYAHILQHEPNVLGNLVWPYLHKDWCIERRFSSILQHYTLLKGMPKFLDVSDGQPKEIVSLDQYSARTSIILDKPRWFVREGEIVLNIFHDDLRTMSVAFIIGQHNNEITLYIGGIQGIHSGVASDKSLEIIKQLTKDFHGLRPRSFVITALRMIAAKIGATKICAIDQAHRHHRHPYFRSSANCLNNTNYDEIWKEHEGVQCDDGFYALKTFAVHKEFCEIESKKRSMYRKRYQMLDYVQQQISQLN
jgi:uncharacterized protein VirK/YbjX